MSISAMKQALKFCEDIGDLVGPYPYVNETSIVADSRKVLTALRQAIAEAEKQEPVAWVRNRGMWCTGELMLQAEGIEKEIPLYTAPVHASDISQERVDETAKRKHEWVGLDDDIPGLGLVTEEFYNGMLCAEDILRKRNT